MSKQTDLDPLSKEKPAGQSSGAIALFFCVVGWALRFYAGMRGDSLQSAIQWNFVGVLVIAVGGALGLLAIIRRQGRITGIIAVLLMLSFIAERVASQSASE